jgi:hypothetical protein
MPRRSTSAWAAVCSACEDKKKGGQKTVAVSQNCDGFFLPPFALFAFLLSPVLLTKKAMPPLMLVSSSEDQTVKIWDFLTVEESSLPFIDCQLILQGNSVLRRTQS